MRPSLHFYTIIWTNWPSNPGTGVQVMGERFRQLMSDDADPIAG